MARATPDGMRRRAELEDEGKYTVLILSVTAAIADSGFQPFVTYEFSVEARVC